MRKATERTVLCVDDDAALLRALTICLEASGFAVCAQSDPANALQLLSQRSFYAIVLDYLFPNSNGGELAAAIKARFPATPIIFFSGSVALLSSEVCALAEEVIDKKQGISALLSALERLTNLRPYPTVRKYPRYPVRLPFELTVQGRQPPNRLQGHCTTLAEGGMAGVLQGEIRPGDIVSISLASPDLADLQPRAAVRYRHHDACGFEFLNLTSSERQVLRQCCERWQAASAPPAI